MGESSDRKQDRFPESDKRFDDQQRIKRRGLFYFCFVLYLNWPWGAKMVFAVSSSFKFNSTTPLPALFPPPSLSNSHQSSSSSSSNTKSVSRSSVFSSSSPTPFIRSSRSSIKMAGNTISGLPKDIPLETRNGTQGKSSLVVCFGEMLIDFVPTVGGVSLAEAPAFKKAPGGAPANVAVGISRLGGAAAFIGKVGEDEFGFMLADILKQNNVDNSGMRFDPAARTALAFVTLRADGEREFMFFRNPSADMLLHESELNVDLIKQASIFHYGSISLIEEPCRSTHIAAMKIASQSGSMLSYDPNLRLPLWPSAEAARQGIMSIWDQADIIKISEEEISFLTGGDDPYDDNVVLNKLFHPNLKLLLVTEGPEGCRYYTKEFKGRVSGFKVKAVDTTGAGDAFVSGILNSLAFDKNLYKDEKRLRDALLFANACGALTVTERGAIPALPTKDAVLQVLPEVAA